METDLLVNLELAVEHLAVVRAMCEVYMALASLAFGAWVWVLVLRFVNAKRWTAIE